MDSMYDAQTPNTGDFQTVRIESRPQILAGNIIDRPGAHLYETDGLAIEVLVET